MDGKRCHVYLLRSVESNIDFAVACLLRDQRDAGPTGQLDFVARVFTTVKRSVVPLVRSVPGTPKSIHPEFSPSTISMYAPERSAGIPFWARVSTQRSRGTATAAMGPPIAAPREAAASVLE